MLKLVMDLFLKNLVYVKKYINSFLFVDSFEKFIMSYINATLCTSLIDEGL